MPSASDDGSSESGVETGAVGGAGWTTDDISNQAVADHNAREDKAQACRMQGLNDLGR